MPPPLGRLFFEIVREILLKIQRMNVFTKMVVDQRTDLSGFLMHHKLQQRLMLFPDSLQLFGLQHVQPTVPEVVHIGLLNQIPQKLTPRKPA